MSRDDETLSFYDRAAADYADRFAPARPDRDLRAFMAALPPGGTVLDFGCGPGQSAALLRDAGFAVTAWDASQGMLDEARERFGITGRLARFDELEAAGAYDGVFANFSLLHAPRAEMPGHLARIHRALKPGGVLHLGLKEGTGAGRDQLGRFYTYYTEDELRELLTDAGFTIVSVRRGHGKGMAGTDDAFLIVLAHG